MGPDKAKAVGLFDRSLIMGSGGMLGHALADLLARQGRVAVAPPEAELDITDDATLARAFAAHQPTLVLNCAAHTQVDRCEQEEDKANAVNGTAVGKIAGLCQSSGACLLHVSTDFVFDGSQRRPYAATDPANPLCAYGRSKLLGETELQKHAPRRWVIVRTAWVYGRHGANFPRTMVQMAQAGKPLAVVNDQWGAPTYVADLAEAIVDLLDSGAEGIWHMTNSGQTTWFDFARATLEEFGIPAEVAPLSSGQWMQKRPASARRPSYSVLDLTALTRQLGREPRQWRAALVDYRQAVRQAGF